MSYEKYRKHASNCLRLASKSNEPKTKAMLLDMAQNWQRLADQADKNSRIDLVYETPRPK